MNNKKWPVLTCNSQDVMVNRAMLSRKYLVKDLFCVSILCACVGLLYEFKHIRFKITVYSHTFFSCNPVNNSFVLLLLPREQPEEFFSTHFWPPNKSVISFPTPVCCFDI